METLDINGIEFIKEQTGGGCTALVYYAPNGYCYMITEHDDPSAPETIETMVDFGATDSEGYEVFGVENIKINQISFNR